MWGKVSRQTENGFCNLRCWDTTKADLTVTLELMMKLTCHLNTSTKSLYSIMTVLVYVS